MSDPATLVVEILTEELPPKALLRLGEAFADGIAGGLKTRGYTSASSAVIPYASPRRLAVAITGVLDRSPDQPQSKRLMPARVAYDAAGAPTPAFGKRLEKEGYLPGVIPASDLKRRNEGGTEYVYLDQVAAGSPLVNGLEAALDDALEKLPIPKVMSYAGPGSYYNDVKFVRPAHRLLALHGANVVTVSALGIKAGRVSSGHRFLARADLSIASADAFDETLRAEGKVIASFAERRAAIVAGLSAAAGSATVLMPGALLDEVTGLVEWPVVYAGTFDAAFLAVPQECLILTMQQNQRYFALADAGGKLVPRFLVVSNIETADPAAIVEGNERVLRARLADARFFFDQDRKIRLEARVAKLAHIVHHNRLGTQHDRVMRLVLLAGDIARLIDADPAASERAALLAKADLATDMVGEFPELQGVMGRYYAQGDGEGEAIAAAIEQHYWPRFAGDALPEGGVAQAVALADKLETLVAMFGIGAPPTGDKDPLGLRRHAIGVLRILIERKLPVTLGNLIDAAFARLAGIAGLADAREGVANFLYERLRAYLREAGHSANEAEAVLSQRPARIDLVPAQAAAVKAFAELSEAGALAGANKRIVNILRKAAGEAAPAVDRGRLADGAEHDLYLAFQHLDPIVDARCAAGDFTGALMALATARPAVDRFFDDVMVMADDPAVRANRLALLRGVAQTMNRVADISKLAA